MTFLFSSAKHHEPLYYEVQQFAFACASQIRASYLVRLISHCLLLVPVLVLFTNFICYLMEPSVDIGSSTFYNKTNCGS